MYKRQVINNVEAIGRKLGELRIKELNENHERITHLFKELKAFSEIFKEFQKSQEIDGEELQDYINNLLPYITKDGSGSIEEFIFPSMEERQPRGRRNKRKNQPIKKNV